MIQPRLPGTVEVRRPKWDRDRRQLRLGTHIVKEFKVPATNQEIVLAVFEEEFWPPRIDDPLPRKSDIDPQRRLHDTINSLNRRQRHRLLHFSADGLGQSVRWELADLKGEVGPFFASVCTSMMDIDRSRGGWQPDLPDQRDYTVQHAAVQRLLRRLKPAPDQAGLPVQVDWREYCAPIQDQGGLPTSSAHACVALVQYFERRAIGRLLQPSRLFVHCNASHLLQQSPKSGVPMRAALKAVVRFGGPPERHWPYDDAALKRSPPPFAYGFARLFNKIRFVRLDGRQQTGSDTLRIAQGFLAAGFPFVLGFPVSNAVGRSAEIPFPTVFDGILGGMAAMAVGYDDNLRIRSDKGAMLLHTSWGTDWGDHGYGWLPYAYIRERLALDLWTMLKRSWLRSGELYRPEQWQDGHRTPWLKDS